jgi:secondary thiamine-phosphate synthase enzyme
MIKRVTIEIQTSGRGFWLITDKIINQVGQLPENGIINLFLQHTSAALTINENADPDVRHDLAAFFDHQCPDGTPYFTHTMEGNDDMPAHVKSSLLGVSLTIPIHEGRLDLGIWQGIYLCEFRNNSHKRTIIANIFS